LSDDERARAIAEITAAMKTETRVKLLLELNRGDKRPSDILKSFEESPTTIYRAIDGFIAARIVEKVEDGEKVIWRLTPLGRELVSSMLSVVGARGEGVVKGKRYLVYMLPLSLFIIALAQSLVWQKPSYIAGGAILSLAMYILLRRLLR